MRHGMMIRTLAAAVLALVVGGQARAADGCNTCGAAPVVVQGVGHQPTDCGPCEKKTLLSRLKSSSACCDAKFILGSSKSFFNACNPGCSDLPISACRDRQRCAMPTYGTGIGQPANNCSGPFTFQNR